MMNLVFSLKRKLLLRSAYDARCYQLPPWRMVGLSVSRPKMPFGVHLVKKIIAGLLVIEGIVLFSLVIYDNGGRFWKAVRPEDKEKTPVVISKVLDGVFGSVTVSPETLKYDPPAKDKQPYKILINRIGLDLEVELAKVIGSDWEVSERKASFMLGSAMPGALGNTVIYGHAKDQIFGALKKVKLDDSIYVLTNEKWFNYRVSEIREVLPEQTEVVAPTTDATLTLFTCTAFLDSKRLVVIGKLVDRESGTTGGVKSETGSANLK